MAQATLSRPPVADHLRPVETRANRPALQELLTTRERVAMRGNTSRFRLPPQPTPLLDRAAERRLATGLLVDEGVRLLTLVGPGGVGKTHLALALAETIAPSFARDARFVDLSAIPDMEAARSLVHDAVRDGCLVEPERATPWSADDRDDRILLVLDNCEHLLPALAHEVAELLVADRGLVVLATSREPLHLRCEHRLPVHPLGLPDPADEASLEALLATPAVALFVTRARAVRPDFALTPENSPAVGALCRRLDGLPLAIELAAARIDLFSPDAMLDRLERHLPLPTTAVEDAPARHRTLDATVGWGYAQLQPREQALFRRLAFLAGAWTPDTAAAVGDTASLGLDGLTALITLADKGLLQASGAESGEVRFVMLETIRAVALRELESSGELPETRRRHAAWSSLHGGRGTTSPGHPGSPNGAPTARPVVSPLSERERDVLRLVAEGLPSKQIGRELGLAERTVKAHVTGAMNKLGAFSRAQALGIAVERHYL